MKRVTDGKKCNWKRMGKELRDEERKQGCREAKVKREKEVVRIKRLVKPHLGAYRYVHYLCCTCDMKLQHMGEAKEHW